MRVKILSWNIWVDGNFGEIADFLKAFNADIIGLQEVQADDQKRDAVGFLKSLGYECAFAPIKKVWGGKTWNDGPAIFSRYKMVKAETYLLSKVKARAAVRADIKIGDKILRVFNVHLAHTHQRETAEQNEQAENFIKALSPEWTIALGDFNATPTSAVIRKMRSVMVDADYSEAPTWSVYPEGCLECNPRKIDTRLDYIFLSKDIKLISAKVENSRASDHLPISAIIEI
jgi:endonuclease/exonuclease/phosphatase family metal-dependent hydrolase